VELSARIRRKCLLDTRSVIRLLTHRNDRGRAHDSCDPLGEKEYLALVLWVELIDIVDEEENAALLSALCGFPSTC
jgi:hypothetical protein